MTKHETLTAAAEMAGVTLIPLNHLKKSPRNVRRMPHGEASLDILAASIAAVGILQNLVVEPELADDGTPTGDYLVTAGEGRRLAQLLRVKRREIRKSEPMPCRIETTGNAREISLHENSAREAMHPADQFEAFQTLIEIDGFAVEDVAARFGVTATVVKQRLRLAAVAPALLQTYRDGAMNLDQLMAFAITDDHARQEALWAQLSDWNNDPNTIRRRLMQDHVRHDDRRVIFVGNEAYLKAGGVIDQDLFDLADGGGYYRDVALLDQLAFDKLTALAADVREREGWKWASAQFDFPHGIGMRRVYPQERALSEADAVELQTAGELLEGILAQYEGGELPADVAPQVAELECSIAYLEGLKRAYDPGEVARAGVLVTLDSGGQPRFTRGLVRAEDELPVVEELPEGDGDGGAPGDGTDEDNTDADSGVDDGDDEGDVEPVHAGLPLPDMLVRDLTAHRTLALRYELSQRPELALTALTHALAAQTFYRQTEVYGLDIRAISTDAAPFENGDPSPAATALRERHDEWAERVPANPADLWAFVAALDHDETMALFAHCTSITLDAVKLPHLNRVKGAAAIDAVAAEIGLDMADKWQPTVTTFFGRITKPQILQTVSEVLGTEVAARLKGLTKPVMAEEAERLLKDSRWLPPVLRTQPAVKAENKAEEADSAAREGEGALAAE